MEKKHDHTIETKALIKDPLSVFCYLLRAFFTAELPRMGN